MTATPQPPSPMVTPLPWNLVAADFATEVVPQFEHYAKLALRLAKLPAGARIIDVACGPGTLALLAAPHVEQVDALDFSEAMAAQLHRRMARDDVRNVLPLMADGQVLPFADEVFDTGFSMFGLMFSPDRHRGFSELRRVVRPGGKVVVSSWLPLGQVPAMGAIFAALGKHMPANPGPPPKCSLTTAEDYHAEMTAAGLVAVQVEQTTAALQTPDTATPWAGMEKTLAPAALLRARIGPVAWPAVSAAILADLVAVLGSGPQQVPMAAWLGVGTVG